MNEEIYNFLKSNDLDFLEGTIAEYFNGEY